ncbi:MAG: hypothetical protein DHS20C07_19090 [Methyloligella sp.]|nr:MAG: hypothetical protein DHS20C07_19090 [Methyloligella sp.]
MAKKKKEDKKVIGRPTDYTDELADKICEYIANGNSLNRWLNEDKANKPNRTTIYDWLNKHAYFADNYARAKQDSADFHAEKILEVAEREDLNPNDKRVRIDAMKWVASKLKPKSYGDRVAHEHTDGEGKPLENSVNLAVLKTEDLDSLAELLNKASS